MSETMKKAGSVLRERFLDAFVKRCRAVENVRVRCLLECPEDPRDNVYEYSTKTFGEETYLLWQEDGEDKLFRVDGRVTKMVYVRGKPLFAAISGTFGVSSALYWGECRIRSFDFNHAAGFQVVDNEKVCCATYDVAQKRGFFGQEHSKTVPGVWSISLDELEKVKEARNPLDVVVDALNARFSETK